MDLKFRLLPDTFAIHRLPPDCALPTSLPTSGLLSITRTNDELSIVCEETANLPDTKCEPGWRCLKLEGPFPFSQTGVLACFLAPLAERKISIFAVSTFDTDYVLVKTVSLESALAALQSAGHRLVPS